ncbi:Na+/H+ antiporter NhaC family protein [Metabacillus sp. KIGAM252]|uniref:Na+/H+ antiporter NhaC family protein n=1 Tax=Metabacillus flavus TaxID=2823519 RepID=A0ABS5LBE0_9BACI|nr:Na+/H+ antiporter NhaC family protein [Metabacillus flavus]MBS2968027.1 Na+/H+ antiporter NhaC family protein [Metabacillus flavus]
MDLNNGTKRNPLALLPLLIFISLFILAGVITGDFYKLPMVVAILVAVAVALFMNRKENLTSKVERFAKGAGHPDIMIMVFIYILAGAFSEAAKGMGAVESTVNLALTYFPQSFLVVGLFIIAAFVSISMGTSMGTIAALGPIAAGISGETEIPVALAVASVIGGAMFGDNLSFISDTTIAAVRSQKTEMLDKFKTNFFIVLPAAIVTVIVLVAISLGMDSAVEPKEFSFVKLLPYIGVLIAALAGLNVVAVLGGGIVLTGVIGLADGSFNILTFSQTMMKGISGMSELIILSVLIGGMVELIKHNGGIAFLLNAMTKNIRTKKGAEFGIAGLVSATNLSTANNTISIITAGPLAKNIADQYGIDKRKSASILDIFSCSVQGLIPYGAQMLAGAQLVKASPLSILPYTFYPMLTLLCGILAIAFGLPRLKPKAGHRQAEAGEMKENYTN